MHNDPREVVSTFYEAFKRKDAQVMAACYAGGVEFSDPVFPNLRGEQAKGMWKMLCQNGKDLRVEYRITGHRGDCVHVHWDAFYSFSQTGRSVHNRIDAELHVYQGKIIRHQDRFSFWRWARQALGPVGLILGWTPLLKSQVRKKAATSLATFLKH